MVQCMLTTVDNPYNPFDDFTAWFSFDTEKGYNSCSLLMRIAQVSDEMTDVEENMEIERAINDIIKYDFRDVYKKVSRELMPAN